MVSSSCIQNEFSSSRVASCPIPIVFFFLLIFRHALHYSSSDIDDGNFVKSMALKDMDLKARPNAKKSTLIIHSSKKVNTVCTVAEIQLQPSCGQNWWRVV